jgi:preprotein translocase subunit SecY
VTNIWPFESCRVKLLMKTCFLKLHTVCTTFLQQTEIWIIVSCVVARCCNTDDQSKHFPLHLIQVSWKTPLFTIQWTAAEDSLVHIIISNYVFSLLYDDMNEQVQYWSSNRYFCHILT